MPMPHARSSSSPVGRSAILAIALAALAALAACGPAGGPASHAGPAAGPIHLGAVFPLHGALRTQALDEERAVEIAVALANRAGGRRIVLDVADVEVPEDAFGAVDTLRAKGAQVIIGGYSSDLSIAISAAADRDGLVYWEAGAVADQLTGRGLPRVFRVGASGHVLGDNSAAFVATQLVPRLGRPVSALRVALVTADDAYAHSVADAARARAAREGMAVVSEALYDPRRPDFSGALAGLRAAPADILVLSSHIPDGIAFRRAFLAAHLHVDAFIGSTMAQCMDDFGEALGPDAVGVFASDRPGDGFSADRLAPAARQLFEQLAAAWRLQTGGAAPDEEAISGFAAAWPLVTLVLPRAAAEPAGVTPESVARAARALDLPPGTLPNGAGLRFATGGAEMGQNLRASAVIWQWQQPAHSVVVWPAPYATGSIEMVPLPR